MPRVSLVLCLAGAVLAGVAVHPLLGQSCEGFDSLELAVAGLVPSSTFSIECDVTAPATIPTAIGAFTNLQSLVILDYFGSRNSIGGTIPTEIGLLTGLTELWVAGPVTGVLPSELLSLTGLETLRINAWQLGGNIVGSIPAELSLLTNLTELSMSSPGFVGTLPASIFSMTNLETLTFSGELEINTPSSLADLTELRVLGLIGRSLGPLPSGLGLLPRLRGLSLGVLLDGAAPDNFPASIFQASNLEFIGLANYPAAAALYANLAQLSSLTSLDAVGIPVPDMNALVTALGQKEFYSRLTLMNNSLSGTFPTELARLTGIDEINLVNNSLTGTIPESLSALTDLMRLELGGNCLTGTVPAWVDGIRSVEGIPTSGSLTPARECTLKPSPATKPAVAAQLVVVLLLFLVGLHFV